MPAVGCTLGSAALVGLVLGYLLGFGVAKLIPGFPGAVVNSQLCVSVEKRIVDAGIPVAEAAWDLAEKRKIGVPAPR